MIHGRPDPTLAPALEELARRDRHISAAFRVVGLPRRRRQTRGFSGLLRIVMAQQLSVHAAKAIIERLDAATGCDPERLAAASDAELRALGLSRQKIAYGRELATAVTSGALNFRRLHRMDDAAAIAALTEIKGIGRWTAEIYLLFALGRADIMPAGDLAICAAVQRLKKLRKRPDEKRMRHIAESWRPYRSAAACFLWHYYAHPGVPDASG
ncbi:MAG: DNA-3-methyladenine glycosylase 2 family protein [Alphaproteobacteria bacterium]